jgi:hypothetical protein
VDLGASTGKGHGTRAVKAGRGKSLNYPPSQLKPADRKHGPARKVWRSRSWRFPQVLRDLQGAGVSPHMVCSRAEQLRQLNGVTPTWDGDRWLTQHLLIRYPGATPPKHLDGSMLGDYGALRSGNGMGSSRPYWAYSSSRGNPLCIQQ